MRKFSPSCRWWLPLLLFVLIAPLTPLIDQSVASYFYTTNGGFIKQSDPRHPIYSLFYTFGNLPGQIAGVVAALIVAGSFFSPSLVPWRKAALVIAITACVGAGLLVNLVFKELWGRPRPKQLTEYGGTESFRPFYKPIWNHKSEHLKSFPSGHATMGFLFLTFGLIGWYERNRRLYICGMIAGCSLGIVLSYGRLAQGGHFFSDVMASALLTWLIALAACRLVYGPAREVSTDW